MKRIFTILCICLCVIPLFAFPTSAASYDLGDPKRLSYTVAINADVETFPFGDIYSFDTSDRSVDFFNYVIGSYVPYFRYAYDYKGYYYAEKTYFSYGTPYDYDSLSRHIEVTGFELGSNFITYSNNLSVRNKLFFVGLVYENLLLPSDGQYLRIDFSFDSALIQAPDEILSVFDLNDLCYLCDTSGRPGFTDRYSLPKVLASSSSVSKSGNVYIYSFFFNLTPNALSNISDADNVCLAIRIPYYFNSAESFDGGVFIVSNAELPLTYEILTVGGYDQALKDIEDSVDSLKTDLLDFYTTQDSGDVAFISNANNAFDKGNDVINDYNNYNDQIDSIVTNAVVPDVQDIIYQQIGDFSPAVAPVKEFFQNTYIISAFLICFAFCLISVLLYGIRG